MDTHSSNNHAGPSMSSASYSHIHTTATPLSSHSVNLTPIDDEDDERKCKICLGGDDDAVELGPLFTPCLCRGSIRYVHEQCLNKWRASTPRAFWECPQCKFQYAIVRTNTIRVATSKPFLGAATLAILFTVIYVGHMILLFLLSDPTPSASNPLYKSPSTTRRIIDALLSQIYITTVHADGTAEYQSRRTLAILGNVGLLISHAIHALGVFHQIYITLRKSAQRILLTRGEPTQVLSVDHPLHPLHSSAPHSRQQSISWKVEFVQRAYEDVDDTKTNERLDMMLVGRLVEFCVDGVRWVGRLIAGRESMDI